MKNPKCRTCGKEHALGGCPEFQSTAALKEAQPGTALAVKSEEVPVPTGGIPSEYQASPVDTHPKPKIGRPRTGFNKKEYNRRFTADLRTIKRLGLNMTVKEYRTQLAVSEEIRKDYAK